MACSMFDRGGAFMCNGATREEKQKGQKDVRRIFWAETKEKNKRVPHWQNREKWWIEHEHVMRNEKLLSEMSSLRQWCGEHCCHFLDEFHLQRHQFIGCSISCFCLSTGRLWKPNFERGCQPQWFCFDMKMKAPREKSTQMYPMIRIVCCERSSITADFLYSKRCHHWSLPSDPLVAKVKILSTDQEVNIVLWKG